MHNASLSNRLVVEMNPEYGNFATKQLDQNWPLSSISLPKLQTPNDELWAIQTALEMGEPVHVAFRRVHLALARYEQARTRPDDKRDPKDGWTVEYDWDVGTWYATQSGLWDLLGELSFFENWRGIDARPQGLIVWQKFMKSLPLRALDLMRGD
jgi:anaphase-promoting complex subunit 5